MRSKRSIITISWYKIATFDLIRSGWGRTTFPSREGLRPAGVFPFPPKFQKGCFYDGYRSKGPLRPGRGGHGPCLARPTPVIKWGAALLCADGTVYQGCNIENASYTPTVCAERTAFFKAVYDGHRDFTAIAVCGGKDSVLTGAFPPCGVCRQVMQEFCEDDFLLCLVTPEGYETHTLARFCPSASPQRPICNSKGKYLFLSGKQTKEIFKCFPGNG